MITGNLHTTPEKTTEVILPFHALISILRQNGFLIKPDDYIEMLKVIEKFGSGDLKKAGPLICPLIATSPEQQEKFYKVFDQYVSSEKEITQPVIPPAPSYKKWVLIIGSLVVLLLVFFLLKNKSQPQLSANFIYTPKSVYRVGDTLELNAENSGAQQKTAGDKISYFWKTDKGWKKGPANQKFVLQQEGNFVVQLKVQSNAFAIKDSIRTDTFLVCRSAPSVSLSATQKDQFNIGDSIYVSANFPQQNNSFTRTLWKINETDTTRNANSTTLAYRFDSAGTYLFSFVGVFDDVNSPCVYIQNLDQPITIQKEKNYSLSTQATGMAITSFRQSKLNPILNWLFIIPALALVAGTFLWWQRKKKKLNEPQKTEPLIFEGKEPPYETPFENKDLQLINRENIFNSVFRSFRQKAEDEVLIFNVPKTIRSTIQSGGFPEFVFTRRLRYNDYLILIDRSISNNQQTRLLNYLVKVLNEEAISVERFYFKQDFDNFVNEEYREGISLKRLSELYKQFTLIILGNAHQLVFDAYPMVEKNILDILNEWEFKAIVTPVSYKDWSEKENILRQKLILLPADIKGQTLLIQAIREQQLQHEKYLSSIDEFYATQDFDFELAEDIEAYLNDEVLFQWLCATCVFHQLRWEIIVEMGKAICSKYEQPEKMNFTNLLKLARISWMQEGSFPGVTRMDLLKKLSPENEVVARETLLHLLEYSETYFGKDRFFEEEKEIQKITSRFILFAHNPEKYPQFQEDEEKFKLLWEHDQIKDTPQKVYLEKKPADSWTTLIKQNEKNVGINEYLNQHAMKKLQNFGKWFWINGGLAITLLLILVFLHAFKNRLPENTKFPLVLSNNTLQYTVIVNDSLACPDENGSNNIIQNISGNLYLGNTPHLLHFSSANAKQWKATTAINYNSADSNAQIQISWKKGKEDHFLQEIIPFTTNTLQASIKGCESVPAKMPLYVRYNNEEAYNAIKDQLFSALNQYDIAAIQQTFTDSSYLIYYEENQKATTDSVVRAIKEKFGINVNTRFVPEKRTPPAVPILFLNITPAGCNFALPQKVNEIWHGGTSNRLVHIDLTQKLIYYSTGDKNTYGTYRINEICFDNNTYKIITQANNQYQVFLVRNIQSGSFDLSVCQNRYNTVQEARSIDETFCDHFNTMTPYYENDNNKIFLSFNPNVMDAADKQKLNRLNDSIASYKNRGYTVKLAGTLYYNSKFRWSIPGNFPNPIVQTIALNNETPFDRSYVQYRFSAGKPSYPNCNITFTSIREIQKLESPLIACKLNLANQKLTSIPKEIYTLKNLKELNLSNNPIPQSEVQQLQKQLPDCKIIYRPSKPIVDTTHYLLNTIEFDDKDYPDASFSSFIERLGALLKNNPDYQVSLYVYYAQNTIGYSRARTRVNNLRNMLLKAGGGAKQMLTAFNQLPDSQPQQKQMQKQNSSLDNLREKFLDRIAVYGIGFKEVSSAGYGNMNKSGY